jgi:hypothetical protein
MTAHSTTVGRRLAPELVYIDGEPCTKGVARKAATCLHSRKPIRPGDEVYRPLGNSMTRSARYLAAEIEALERAPLPAPKEPTT